MKKLSKWAKHHPVTARWIIAAAHVLVVLNALVFGTVLFLFEFGSSGLLLNIATVLFFIAYLFYPKKDSASRLFAHSYVRQKIHDFSLVFLYGLVLALGVNNMLTAPDTETRTLRHPTARLMSLPVSISDNETVQNKPFRREMKAQFREFKKQMRQELKQLKKELRRQGDNNLSNTAKVLLILLTIGCSVVLGYLVAALACNIACSGNEGAALLVLIAGFTGIIFLMIFLILRITRPSA